MVEGLTSEVPGASVGQMPPVSGMLHHVADPVPPTQIDLPTLSGLREVHGWVQGCKIRLRAQGRVGGSAADAKVVQLMVPRRLRIGVSATVQLDTDTSV